MKKIIASGTLFLALLLFSCDKDKGLWYNHKWEDLHPNGQASVTGPAATCDTTGTISYSLTVQPILTQNCATNSSCHGAGSANPPADYTVFSNVVTDAHNSHGNDIMSRLNLPSSNTLHMPKTGSLVACDIAKIRIWIQQGCLHN